MNAQDWIDALGMQAHPEGGFFVETYRSGGRIPAEALEPGHSGERSFSTAIYFLLRAGERSHFHRLASDEMWHLYNGGPVDIFELRPDGNMHTQRLGLNIATGERPQALVRADTWFAARVCSPASFVLVGCTVAPGFDFADFELAERAQLLERHPQHENLITEFTRV